jgi:hypothetical protein
MSGLFVGAMDGNQSGVFPGWGPDRNPKAKW